jgi:hypothetical protein
MENTTGRRWPKNEIEATRRRIVDEVGIPLDCVTDDLVAKIADDPLFLHHLDVCKGDSEMLAILTAETGKSEEGETAAAPATTPELLARAMLSLSSWAKSRFSRIDGKEYQRRLSICRSCVHLSTPVLFGIRTTLRR